MPMRMAMFSGLELRHHRRPMVVVMLLRDMCVLNRVREGRARSREADEQGKRERSQARQDGTRHGRSATHPPCPRYTRQSIRS